uniref:NADH-ubiquinone oxidoreductase chain 6 n=1 Tax=Ensatina eschscholtzii TaxID=57550 RepID=Q644Z9_9SALA|nr:NADH dehydrogenase subunit 6 [Ensatina eschscholtzii]AAU20485.1 NADH dehydrogenase subunit 6 [Ensatina eschscholtzii]
MIYINFLIYTLLILGFIAVASNPSPFYAAFGLMLSAACGCWILVDFGISFLSLVLLLIYLGGMLVVFAYSVSLAAESYPEAWGNMSVLIYIFIYVLGLSFFFLMGEVNGFEGVFSGESMGLSLMSYDCSGVGLMYSAGKGILLISGWTLLLTLFVVLEITRGVFYGSLRVV